MIHRGTTRVRRTAHLLMMLVLAAAVVTTAAPPEADALAMCSGKAVTVNIGAGDKPTNGDDVIMGTNGPDTIHAGGGNDTICGLSGDDAIRGGPGNDIIAGQNGNDWIDGADGNDRIWGGWGNDTIRGGNGADVLAGMGGNDSISGQNGNDWMDGADGNDRIWGGWGNDKILGGEGNDALIGAGGADEIYGQNGDDVIAGGDGDDQIWGGWGKDKIEGQNGSDVLHGDGHDDTLLGGNGNDTLYGGSHNDTLNGDAGTDTANGGTGEDKCIAESYVACLEVPGWVWDAEVVLESVSQYDFSFSWSNATGDVDFFDITVTRMSDGYSEPPHSIRVTDPWEWRVSEFDGAIPDKDDTYMISIVGTNAAGESDEIKLGPISVLGDVIPLIETGQTSNRMAASAMHAPSPAARIVACDTPTRNRNIREVCIKQKTENGRAIVGFPVSFYIEGGFIPPIISWLPTQAPAKLVTMTAETTVHHEGPRITVNRDAAVTCIGEGGFPFNPVDTTPNRAGGIEPSGAAYNVFGCNLGDEIPVTTSAGANHGLVSGGVSTQLTIGLAADLVVVHIIESVSDTEIIWRVQAFQADGRDGEIHFETCEQRFGSQC